MAVLREAGWSQREIYDMTPSQVNMWLHLATRGEERRAKLIGFEVADHVAAVLGLKG